MHPRAACDMEDRVARALCVVHLFVEEARKRKDVIKLACLRDKEMQLEVLRDRLEDADRAVKADKLERESERCIGELALHL